MTPKAYNLGLIGFPLGHSLSAHMHKAALRALELGGEYLLYSVPPLPEGVEKLESLMGEMRDQKIDGLNVTIPHKRSVLPYMDALSSAAEDIGAVNTVCRQERALVGVNTDVDGFITDLQRCLPHEFVKGRALVLGAGGAARAVVYALLDEGWHVGVAARRLDQAYQLADDVRAGDLSTDAVIEPLVFDDLWNNDGGRWVTDHPEEPILIVNATPLGMTPDTGSSPWPEGVPWPRRGLAYDLVYNPLDTAYMRQARAAGLYAVGGLGMLVEQAALAFQRWTGIEPPREVMQQAALKGLGTEKPGSNNQWS